MTLVEVQEMIAKKTLLKKVAAKKSTSQWLKPAAKKTSIKKPVAKKK
jgi:DNA topoisomerase-1